MPVAQPVGAIRTLGTGISADSIFSPDGSLLYTVAGNTVSVFQTSGGAFLTSYSFGSSLGRIDISPNGASLAIVENNPVSGSGTIYRLSLTTGTVETFSFAGTGLFYDLAYLADGRLFTTQVSAGPLRLINLDTSGITVIGTIDAGANVTISADNSYAIALPRTITRPIYGFDLDTGTGHYLHTLPDPYAGASLPSDSRGIGAVSPDGTLIDFVDSGRLYSADLQTFVPGPGVGGSGVVFSPDGSRIYSVSEYSDRVSVIDVATRQVLSTYDIRADVTGPIELRVSDDGIFLAITSANGVQLINTTTVVPDPQPTAGNDTLYGNFNDETIAGLGGQDIIYGGAGNDRLGSHSIDANGSISLDVFNEHDTLYGEDGSDRLYAGYGDTVDGGPSVGDGDTLFLSLLGAPSGVNVDFRQPTLTIGGGTISGVENLAWVQGSNFADTINAGNNPSYITGGNNVLGMGGNDVLIAGTNTYSVDGGEGDDTIDGTLSNGTFSGGSGNDVIYTAIGGNAIALGGNGDDLIYANRESHGGAGNDVINVYATASPWGHWGDSGNDTINGSSGNDFLLGGSGADTIDGGAGNDIIGTADNDPLAYQQPASDMGLEKDSVIAGDGNDTVAAGYGDNADGGTGSDQLFYSFGGLQAGIAFNTSTLTSGGTIQIGGGTIQGFEAVPQITMTEYADQITLSAHLGDLSVFGAGGNDAFTYQGFSDPGAALRTNAIGGDGDDILLVNAAQFDEEVVFVGGAGSDTVDFGLTVVTGIRVTLSDLAGNLVFAMTNGGVSQATNVILIDDENLMGTNQSDTFIGNSQSNRLDGRSGADALNGASGDDTLIGGAGIDNLTGGDGADTFLDTRAGLSGDTITDFSAADRILITDATLAGFSFSLTGSTLTYTGGSLTLTGGFAGQLVASAAAGGGVQLSVQALVAIADVQNDFNGDGRSDILWRNVATDQFSDWLGLANGGFAGNDANAFATVPTSWSIVGTGDFNGDGRDDVLWRNSNGQLSDWLGTANGGFTPNDANALTTVPTSWHVVGTGDFNGDGRDDILWRNDAGQLSDWLGQANGGFVGNDANAFASVPTNWHVAGTGDFNGDGRDDILWRNDAGQLSDWLGQANGGFTPNDANAFASAPTNWHIVGTGDFNGDGRDDILWRSDAGQLSDWLGQANGAFVGNDANAFTTVPTSWSVVAIGDYNGDGRDDILWRNANGQLSDWLGNANGGFTPNDANASTNVPTNWHVQTEAVVL